MSIEDEREESETLYWRHIVDGKPVWLPLPRVDINKERFVLQGKDEPSRRKPKP